MLACWTHGWYCHRLVHLSPHRALACSATPKSILARPPSPLLVSPGSSTLSLSYSQTQRRETLPVRPAPPHPVTYPSTCPFSRMNLYLWGRRLGGRPRRRGRITCRGIGFFLGRRCPRFGGLLSLSRSWRGSITPFCAYRSLLSAYTSYSLLALCSSEWYLSSRRPIRRGQQSWRRSLVWAEQLLMPLTAGELPPFSILSM